MTFYEIWKEAEKLTKRSVDKKSIILVLQKLGARYYK